MSKPNGLQLNGGKKRIVAFASVGTVILIVAAVVGFRAKISSDSSHLLFKVRNMDIQIIVSEEGVLKAKESEKIMPDIDAEAKVISIVDEGEYVEKGDNVVELDSSGIESKLETLELDLITAKADLDIAQEEVRKYEQGEYPQTIKELDFAIVKAQARLDKAQDEMPKEMDSNIYSKSELTEARINLDEAKMNLTKANLDRKIFEEFTHKKNLLEKRTRAESAKTKYESKIEKREEYVDQLSKMVLKAPCPGLVIYGTGSEGGRGRRGQSDDDPIKVGAIVFKNQVIITIPNISKMQVEAKVHEADIQKITVDLKVTIQIDAFPDLSLTGKVTQIGALAHDRDWRTQGVKVFDVIIDIDGEYQKLRPGMTAKVDIQAETIKNALTIPIEAVFEDPEKGEKYCFVKEGGVPKKRIIQLGKSNDNYVVVREGLKENELVYQYDVASELNL